MMRKSLTPRPQALERELAKYRQQEAAEAVTKKKAGSGSLWAYVSGSN
jgi:hypothetical protein